MSRKFVILHHSDPSGEHESPAGVAPASTGVRPVPRVDTDELAPAKAKELVRNRKVAAVAPVMPMKLIEPFEGQPAAQPAAAVPWGLGAVRALQSAFTGKGVVVAVLDTGIDATHTAFAGVQLVHRNFTSEAAQDLNGHGTHCAATIFGRPVNGLRIGVAPGVEKALIGKVLGAGGGGSDRVAEAIQWAVNGGAHIVSMSLGIDFPGYVEQLIDEGVPKKLATTMALEGYRANLLLFERLAGFVSARGLMAQPTLLIAAAGNESDRASHPDFEIAVSPPAVADGFISVGALGEGAGGLRIADFSNTGARLSAPGVNVVSAWRGGGLTSISGTSMATPHVAGVAALWAEKLIAANSLTQPQWTDFLVGQATRTGLLDGFDPSDVGAGLVQAP